MSVYYIATTGSDGAAGTIGAPWATFAHARSVLVAGDTLFVRAGNYSSQDIVLVNSPNNSSGTSWSSAITYSAYNLETVTLNTIGLSTTTGVNAYMIFKDFIIDANWNPGRVESVYISYGSHHIRFQNCEIMHALYQGVLIPHQSGGYNEILNCNIHNNGTPAVDSTGHTGSHKHGVYCSANNNLIEGNEIYHNTGYGVHLYNSGGTSSSGFTDNNVIRKNRIHHNHWYQSGYSSETFTSFAIILASGKNNQAYNNIIYADFGGITVGLGSPLNCLVYNNTIYNITAANAIDIASDCSGTQVKNNIVWGTHNTINNLGSNTGMSNNLVSQDPKFVNATSGDFHLQSTSPAIDAGITIN